MTIIAGCNGTITFNAQTVGELRSWRVRQAGGRRDRSVMGACVKQFGNEPTESEIEVTCFFDNDDAGQALLIVVGSEQAIVIRPNGTGAGEPELTATAQVEEAEVSADVNGDVEASYRLFVNGGVTVADQS